MGFRENVSYTLTAADRHSVFVPAGFDLRQITSKTNRSTLRPVQPTLYGTGQSHVLCTASDRANAETLQDMSPTILTSHPPIMAKALCMATGQANAGIIENQAPTLTAAHEQPILVHPQITGTLCASGAGLSRPAGMGNETDFCISSAGFRYKAAGTAGSVGFKEETAPTLAAGQPSGVFVSAVDCRNLRETEEVSGTLQAKTKLGGYSLNYTNPVRIGLHVRRLMPLEAERLQGFPDFWTRYGHDGKEISDSKRYSMLGNSIAVPCVAYIMQGIREVMDR